jgi:hypothetical protein
MWRAVALIEGIGDAPISVEWPGRSIHHGLVRCSYGRRAAVDLGYGLCMRVLVTGAGGNLGRCAIPLLARAEQELRLFDFRPVQSDHEFLEGDVRDATRDTAAKAGALTGRLPAGSGTAVSAI